MLYGELIGATQDLVAEIDKGSVITQSKEVSPSTEKIVVVPDSGYYLSQVSVKGVTSDIDPNIKADNIRLGTSILGVEGNLAPDKPDQEKSVVPSKEQQEVVADKGYELAKVVVKATPLEELSVSEDGTYEPSGDNVGFSKVVVSVGGELSSVVEVPEELQGFSAGSNKQLYTFDLEDGTYLVSDSYSKTTWKVSVSTNEWTKLIDNGYVYSFFAKIDDKVLIAHKGGTSAKVYIYDILSSTIQEVVNAITGRPLNTSINSVYDVGDKVLLANTSSGRTVYVYDKATQTIILTQNTTELVDGFKYTWNNKTLIMTRNTSGANEILVYNNLSNTFMFISGVESLARELYFANAKENIVTFSNSTTAVLGFYWLDLDTETFTHAENENVDTLQINQTSILDNGVVLLGKLNTLGVYAYDTNTKTYIAENTESALGNSTMSNPENIIELQDYVLYSRSTSSGGLWQYNKANNTFLQLTTKAYAYVLIVMIMQENRALIGRKGYGFIYSFNNGVLSSALYGAGSSYTYEIVSNTENEIIINNTNFNVQIKYDVETDTITPIGVIL